MIVKLKVCLRIRMLETISQFDEVKIDNVIALRSAEVPSPTALRVLEVPNAALGNLYSTNTYVR